MPNYPLEASGNGRYLVDQDGVPFLMIGDSPQSAITNLTTAQMDTYIANRASRGFNCVIVDMLCSTDTYGKADGTTYDNIKPFSTGTGPSNYDFATPNETYFARADYFIDKCAEYGIVCMIDPAESIDWMATMIANGSTKCANFGTYLGTRYADRDHVMWQHGNDWWNWGNSTEANLVAQMMAGIEAQAPQHLQTVLLWFPQYSYMVTGLRSYLGINGTYNYKDTYFVNYDAHAAATSMPIVLLEANYEFEANHETLGGKLSNLRKQAYWTFTSWGAGYLYGNLYTVRSTWPTSGNLDTTGVTELMYCKSLFTSRQWWLLVPDEDHSVMTAGYGTWQDDDQDYNIGGSTYATAARASDGSFIVCFCPVSTTITVDMTKLEATAIGRWYDPTDGTFSAIAGSPFANSGTHNFATPGNNSSGDPDWVLVLETQQTTPISINLTADSLFGGKVSFTWP